MSEIESGTVSGSGTSTGAAQSPSSVRTSLLAVGLAIALSGSSSSASMTPSTSDDYLRDPPAEVRSTCSGERSMPGSEPCRVMLHDLRAQSGLTWDQLARLLNVSRRSVHLWANGNAVTPANEEHMGRVLAVIRTADQGSPGENRASLLTPSPEGVVPFDLLSDMRYEAARELLMSMRGRLKPRRTPLTVEALANRLPSPPDRLVGALQEPRPAPVTGTRPARSKRTTDRGGG